MHTVVMPKLGDTMEEAKILKWLKQEGEVVQKGDALAEIETEKVNIEVEAFAGGVLRKILAPAGATIAVGAPIALTGEANEALPGEASAAATQFKGKAAAKSAPDAVRPQREPMPAAASPSGPVSLADREYENSTAAATDVHGNSDNANGHGRPARNGSAPDATNGNGHAATTTSTAERQFISPIARRIAAEHHLDLATIHGSGPSGRIIREDVEAALERQESGEHRAISVAAPVAAPTPAAAAATPVAPAATNGEVQAVPLSLMRKTIARRLQQSMQTTPHFYVTMTIDTTRLAEFRQSVNEYAMALPQPVKVSFNDLIVKGVALALARMPEVNASFDGEQLLLKKQINIGVAVALAQGLIVPVVRDADKHGVLDIARESRRLVEAAHAGKLKPEDFQGGTFSVSNLGMFGVEEFTAIINPPESAILAVGAIVPTPVVVDGQVVVRDQMKVTLSSDHRVLDGAVAARFLQELKRLLEQPLSMLI